MPDEAISPPEETAQTSANAGTEGALADRTEPSLSNRSTLAEAIAAFDRHMQLEGFSDNTVKAFQADLRLVAQYFTAARPLNKIGQSELDRFLIWMRAERGVPCSPKTYARRLTTLKVFFGWLAESEVLAKDPAAPLVHERPTTPLPEILYDEQVGQITSMTRDLLWAPRPDARPYLLVSLVLQTAIKKSECMEIKLAHIDTSNMQAPVLYVRYEDSRRTHKERKLALGPVFTPAYRQYLREYAPVERLFECTARNLEYVLDDVAKLSGVTTGISFEQLRWTAAVRDYRNGMPTDHLREKLGLTTISWRETLPKIQRLASPGL